jgi:hypothetical protein
MEGSALTFRMSQQTTASMFGQGYMQTAHICSMPNFTSTPYTPEATIEHTRTLAATIKIHIPP